MTIQSKRRLFCGSQLSYGETWQSVAWEYFAKTGVCNVDVHICQYAKFALTPELMIDEPWHGMWQISIPDLKALWARLGVTPLVALANCDMFYREGVDLIKRRMEFAKKAGIKYFVTGPWPHETWRGAEKVVYDHWKEICDYAETLALQLCVETHGWTMNNARECLETIKNVNRKNFKVAFATSDTYYRNKGLNQEEELKALREHIGAVFLRDFIGEYYKWNFPALGDGIVDFPKIFGMLDEVEFTGPYLLVLEGHPAVFNATVERCHQDVLKSIDYLKKIGVWS